MGYGVGDQCFSTLPEAAQAFCARVGGTTSAGVVSCTAAAPSGGSSVAWTLHLEPGTGSASTRELIAPLPACEPYDMAYWSPILGAFFLALVTVLAARSVYTKVFNRQTL